MKNAYTSGGVLNVRPIHDYRDWTDCNVTTCEEKPALVLEVGGQYSFHVTRFCLKHAADLHDMLTGRLTDDRPDAR